MPKIKTQFTFYNDPGHGWLKVPTKLVRELGIIDQISSCTYMSRDTRFLFLEEDCDAPLFVRTYEEKHGVKLKIKDCYCNKQSKIRNYPYIPHVSYWEWADKQGLT